MLEALMGKVIVKPVQEEVDTGGFQIVGEQQSAVKVGEVISCAGPRQVEDDSTVEPNYRGLLPGIAQPGEKVLYPAEHEKLKYEYQGQTYIILTEEILLGVLKDEN
jgi:co-chaperonin GroES (HSP10)